MEELIDIIIRNPLLILLIIGGLLSFFQDKSSSKKKQQQPAQTVDTKDKVEHTAPQQVEQSQETVKDYLEQIELQEAAEEVGAEANLERLEEHRQKQIERLQKAHYPEVQHTEKAKQSPRKRKQRLKPIKERKPQIDLRQRLNKEGLVESVIMAEVLGKPRAKRKHHRMML